MHCSARNPRQQCKHAANRSSKEQRCGSVGGGGISGVMTVNTHSAPPHRYKAHIVCFGVISFPNMERDRHLSCHSTRIARLPPASHAGDVDLFSLALRWKCMTPVRSHSCGSSLKVQTFAACEKKKGGRDDTSVSTVIHQLRGHRHSCL